jgi:hypothetical protein
MQWQQLMQDIYFLVSYILLSVKFIFVKSSLLLNFSLVWVCKRVAMLCLSPLCT